jgi:hypothetical protein
MYLLDFPYKQEGNHLRELDMTQNQIIRPAVAVIDLDAWTVTLDDGSAVEILETDTAWDRRTMDLLLVAEGSDPWRVTASTTLLRLPLPAMP